MNEKLTLKEYFGHIKGRDKRNLTTTLRALKDKGLDIYLAGSSIYREKYDDIDIVTSGDYNSLRGLWII